MAPAGWARSIERATCGSDATSRSRFSQRSFNPIRIVLGRFDREARALASINHPNIAAIYGVEEEGGITALVLELVEGDTLADRLRRGPIAAADAVSLANQIAAGLDAAHAKDIIHRDLKPANIKVTRSGVAKILDFGLAKAVEEAVVPLGSTVTVDATREGAIVGTAAYMSPEQARGQKVDKRTDIWAFGCVLFEMLSGKRPFAGATVSDSIAAILEREPDWKTLPSGTPPAVRRVLQRCLEKDPQRRLRDIGEVPFALATEVSTGPERTRAVWVISAALVIACVVVAALVFRRASLRSAPAQPIQLTDFNDSAVAPALSADGRMLTFIRGGTFGDSALRGQVYVKLLPSGEPVQLTRDSFNKEQPVFSPDGSRIIYTAVVAGFRWDSWQVPVLGGSPRPFLPNASGLIWIDPRRLMYSEMMSGVHMGIVTSTESRSERRSLYFPPIEGGMAHRSGSLAGRQVCPDRRNGRRRLDALPVDAIRWIEHRSAGWASGVAMHDRRLVTYRRVDVLLVQCGERISHLAAALS